MYEGDAFNNLANYYRRFGSSRLTLTYKEPCKDCPKLISPQVLEALYSLAMNNEGLPIPSFFVIVHVMKVREG
jgi:hypothetical protein